MVDDVLIPEDKLSPHLGEVRRRAAQRDVQAPLDLQTPGWGDALARYMLLEHWPELLADEAVTERQRFYSRYYWFKRFVTAYTEASGPDAGLEQQLFKLMENPEVEVDWSLLEAVDTRAVADAQSASENED